MPSGRLGDVSNSVFPIAGRTNVVDLGPQLPAEMHGASGKWEIAISEPMALLAVAITAVNLATMSGEREIANAR